MDTETKSTGLEYVNQTFPNPATRQQNSPSPMSLLETEEEKMVTWQVGKVGQRGTHTMPNDHWLLMTFTTDATSLQRGQLQSS